MAASAMHPTSSLFLNSTLINVLKVLGHDELIPSEPSIKIPLFYSRTSHKCDLCISIIRAELPHAEIPLMQISDELKTSRISVNLEKLHDELMLLSRSWTLPFKSCQYSKHYFCICFDRQKALASILPTILEKGTEFGWLSSNGKKIFITKDSSPESREDMDVVILRMELAFQSLISVFQRVGYSVTVNDTNPHLQKPNDISVHVSNKSTCKSRPPGSLLILCGSVLTYNDGIKSAGISIKNYYRNKEEKVKQVEKNRDLVEGNDVQVQRLSRAEAIFELLSVKLYVCISINFDESHRNISDHRGAAFLLYNHVRLLSLRHKFEELSKQGIYPELPAISDVNFGLLSQDEEWDIFLLVLRFPLWLCACVSNVNKGRASLHHIVIGLDKLCRVFSMYYRRVRILTEPRTHLMPVMFARLYLLQSVELVLKSGLTILGIHTLDYM